MHLIDCFVELIAYVSYLIQSLPDDRMNFEKVKTDITGLITKSLECQRQHQFPSNDYELAQFAVFAWIDESILGSPWQEKNRWQGEQLQRSYFQTVDAGELFFERLNELQPHQLEVREVYYICLALGFSGRFCNPGDEILLTQLKSSNLKLLGQHYGVPDRLEDQTIFPDAYNDGVVDSQNVKSGFLNLGNVVGFSVPIILFVLLFGIYRFVLSNFGENLMQLMK